MQNVRAFFFLPVARRERSIGRRLLGVLALWHHHHTSRQQLAGLTPRELSDIGISDAERLAECRKRFWQA